MSLPFLFAMNLSRELGARIAEHPDIEPVSHKDKGLELTSAFPCNILNNSSL